MWFVIFACVSLVIGLFAVAITQAYLVKSQQQLDSVRSELAEARAERSQIQREVDDASAPQEIIRRAHELKMIPAGEATHLSAVRPVGPSQTPQIGASGAE